MKIEDYNLSRSEISAIIDEWIFDERERAMLKRRYLDGVCFETLAEEFSLSVQRTKKDYLQGEKQAVQTHSRGNQIEYKKRTKRSRSHDCERLLFMIS